jgi:hypothetical protein
MPSRDDLRWPPLPYDAWRDTYATVHMWTQIIGKIKLALAPSLPHWWHVALSPSVSGLTTGAIPTAERDRSFDIELDFVSDELAIRTSDGRAKLMPLLARPVAEFEAELMRVLDTLGIRVSIYEKPVEVEEVIPFPTDTKHATYDGDAMRRCWTILYRTAPVLDGFRGRFVGKTSPVCFYWGTFDLSLSVFSGRRAPPRPGLDRIAAESYTHELVSVGFWPGNRLFPRPAFFGYAAPEPPGFAQVRIDPPAAYYSQELHEMVLPYDDVRAADDPARMILEFATSVYEAGATLGHWDRAAIERTDVSAGAEAGAEPNPAGPAPPV